MQAQNQCGARRASDEAVSGRADRAGRAAGDDAEGYWEKIYGTVLAWLAGARLACTTISL